MMIKVDTPEIFFDAETMPAVNPSRWLEMMCRSAALLPCGRYAIPQFVGPRVLRGRAYCVRSRRGTKYAVDPSSLGLYCAMMPNGVHWCWNVVDALRALLVRGDVLYDCGASIGTVSLEVAAGLGGDLTVVAVEPQRSLARSLKWSAALNGFDTFRVFDSLLNDRNGEAEFYVGHQLVHASLRRRDNDSAAIASRRPCLTLDVLAEKEQLPPPTAIKLDVEGAELAVLRGGETLLRRHKPLVLFELDANSVRFGILPAELYGFLAEVLDCTFYSVGPRGGIEPMQANDTLPCQSNILAVPRSRSISGRVEAL